MSNKKDSLTQLSDDELEAEMLRRKEAIANAAFEECPPIEWPICIYPDEELMQRVSDIVRRSRKSDVIPLAGLLPGRVKHLALQNRALRRELQRVAGLLQEARCDESSQGGGGAYEE